MEFLKVEDLCKVYGKGENKVTALAPALDQPGSYLQ